MRGSLASPSIREERLEEITSKDNLNRVLERVNNLKDEELVQLWPIVFLFGQLLYYVVALCFKTYLSVLHRAVLAVKRLLEFMVLRTKIFLILILRFVIFSTVKVAKVIWKE